MTEQFDVGSNAKDTSLDAYGVYIKEFEIVLIIFNGRAENPCVHGLGVEELIRRFHVIIAEVGKFYESF